MKAGKQQACTNAALAEAHKRINPQDGRQIAPSELHGKPTILATTW
jgi:hypothetical protein